ncbi:PREDICTED: delta-like protein D isoform X2 [Priapulus caudatus]|uniref:Delta-like protein n=1 Tax=Priapulus caudatus TaxID=37621 RepID=A0ABM1EI32_PRICU|nr:PREDICTED: delta-like protein D isoform X2 [Priapulus caudatus]
MKHGIREALWICGLFYTMLVIPVETSGVFELKLLAFNNPNKLDQSGACCSGERTQGGACTGWCRTYFRVCISHYKARMDQDTKCTFGSGSTPVLGYSQGYNFTKEYVGFPNPFRFPFSFTWPRFFTLTVDAFHQSGTGAPTSQGSRLVLGIATQRMLRAGVVWTEEAVHNDHQAELLFEYRALCDPRYFGDNCTDLCHPRNDQYAGHYTCGARGQRVCLSGWSGAYCTDAICLSGCHKEHGFCELPGECKCRPGYNGKLCDRCMTYPGCQHGTCQSPWECTCLSGWGGMLCNNDLNFCGTHKPCNNGGTCTNTGLGFYTCMCPKEFTGRSCETSVDKCKTSSCFNGGTCANNKIICKCQPGFIGQQCETRAATCAHMPCLSGGTCVNTTDGYFCDCPVGIQGIHCEQKERSCADDPCLNGGMCVDDDKNGFKCICLSDFKGRVCDQRTNDCSFNPCLNGATCLQQKKSIVCVCPEGFMGSMCQSNINECASNPCTNAGTCYDLVNDYVCKCLPGFGGKQCRDNIDDCAQAPCKNGGSCEDQINGFLCQCPYGYTGETCATPLPGFERSDAKQLNAETSIQEAKVHQHNATVSGAAATAAAHSDGFRSSQVAIVACISALLVVCLCVLVVVCLAYRRVHAKHQNTVCDVTHDLENRTNILNNMDTTAVSYLTPSMQSTPRKPGKAVKSTNVDYETYNLSMNEEKSTKEKKQQSGGIDKCYRISQIDSLDAGDVIKAQKVLFLTQDDALDAQRVTSEQEILFRDSNCTQSRPCYNVPLDDATDMQKVPLTSVSGMDCDASRSNLACVRTPTLPPIAFTKKMNNAEQGAPPNVADLSKAKQENGDDVWTTEV